jgi:hypothetical protein
MKMLVRMTARLLRAVMDFYNPVKPATTAILTLRMAVRLTARLLRAVMDSFSQATVKSVMMETSTWMMHASSVNLRSVATVYCRQIAMNSATTAMT